MVWHRSITKSIANRPAKAIRSVIRHATVGDNEM
jgi:hypothetical protein